MDEPIADDVQSMTDRSRHSSIQGPYREITKGNTFPDCNKVPSVLHSIESYSRCLMSTGNGFPVFNAKGDVSRPHEHQLRGVGIGDVGTMGPDGDFTFCFNIFLDPKDSIHSTWLPPNFEQFEPSKPIRSTEVSEHFRPGTVIASSGINVNVTSESPLKFSLNTTAREGGVMVLPDGGSREDLDDCPELLEYIEKHAIDWYQHFATSLKARVSVAVNASLYLITGCDRARSVSSLTIPGTPETAGSYVEMSYNQEESSPWSGDGMEMTRRISVRREENEEKFYSFFLRGIKVALNNQTFIRHVKYDPPEDHYYYTLLTTPILGFGASFARKKEEWFGRKDPYLESRPRVLFHVSDVLLEIILTETPNAESAMIDDSVWIGLVDRTGGLSTVSQVIKLVSAVLVTHELKTIGKALTLVPKPKDGDASPIAGFIGRLRRNLADSRARSQAAARVKKVFDRRS